MLIRPLYALSQVDLDMQVAIIPPTHVNQQTVVVTLILYPSDHAT